GPAGLNAGAQPDIGAYEASSSYLVNLTDDSPAVGTLRTAVGWANVSTNVNPANSPVAPNTIVFSSLFNTPKTITLTAGQLELSNTSGTETITGPAAGVTVSGNNASRVFLVDANVTASISGLTITGGNAGGKAGNGGGLDNLGTATLTNCTVSGNSAANSGGGLRNLGTATLTNCTVSGNSGSLGGGLYNSSGTATLTNTIVAGNTAYPNGGSASDI